MIESVFTYDLFEPKHGRLTVEYNIFERVTESSLIPYSMIREQLETRVRQIICDKVLKMRNQRSENYKYGEMWGITASKALFSLPPAIASARGIKDMNKFSFYVQSNIRPQLDDIIPGMSSRYYNGFIEKLDLLDQYLAFILRNPGFCNPSNRKEKVNKAI